MSSRPHYTGPGFMASRGWLRLERTRAMVASRCSTRDSLISRAIDRWVQSKVRFDSSQRYWYWYLLCVTQCHGRGRLWQMSPIKVSIERVLTCHLPGVELGNGQEHECAEPSGFATVRSSRPFLWWRRRGDGEDNRPKVESLHALIFTGCHAIVASYHLSQFLMHRGVQLPLTMELHGELTTLELVSFKHRVGW
ncbi:hypothetical protein BGZ61DRAFT_83344 [Ilyonectria robusta]|uniref:uncharacterized protein n=1 Tax=Ilyonectria robusta TaxID=1079257 RepID=UPI001E8EDCC2|nr:uncharacterized protein BGZ61DRAFT_83344 [Ilyonectria robusta]KAH8735675.1 hypothetical protein BGZ61DRAFT_83344 [Ilyonectria robusta]